MDGNLIKRCNKALEKHLNDEYGTGKWTIEESDPQEKEMHYKVNVRNVGTFEYVVDADLNPKVSGTK